MDAMSSASAAAVFDRNVAAKACKRLPGPGGARDGDDEVVVPSDNDAFHCGANKAVFLAHEIRPARVA